MPRLKRLTTKCWINALCALSLALITAGCATGDKESILPQDGPTMKAVYRRHFSGTEHGPDELDATRGELLEREARREPEPTSELSAYTRDAGSEIRQVFPRLMNKTLILYVFPHLSGAERYPVPGYSTAFPFYEKPEYALPGEREEGY
ncbi:MAG: TIGR03751 family conjugal transfer lipoprotein [Gammaproteobacteria bacterium HGW-Gammaproteobacteria-10]|nr:MAG: TIGR03751 family conjugal transfer lipoprotein [Gammaproteobacteria bacterium HGW-Gammaproteobacteria-10]